MLSGNKKNLHIFPDFGCIHRGGVHMHATFLVGEIADRFLGQAVYG